MRLLNKYCQPLAIVSIVTAATFVAPATAQNKIDTLLGSKSTTYRADDVPAGEQGRYYIPGAAAGKDAISPSSYSRKFKAGVGFNPQWGMSCGDMNFYTNITQEVARLKKQLKDVVDKAKATAMVTVQSVISGFQEYLMSKINPTLAQLSLKNLDKYIEIFEANVKSCQDFENDVDNGKNPLNEIVQIAVADQWEVTIGLVNAGKISLEEAEEEMVREAIKNGVEMADGERYGGKGQAPINITNSLLKAGINLIMARGNKTAWNDNFTVNSTTIKNNPILREFKNAKELYEFIEDIYGAVEKNISKNAKKNVSVNTIAGRGYEKKYVEYRDTYLPLLYRYVNDEMTREEFEKETGKIIPPAILDDIRKLPPYEKSVEIEQQAQQYAIKRVRENLIFARQALKTGIYAPDMQDSDMRGVAEKEFKTLYYRINDDIVEISQRAYQY